MDRRRPAAAYANEKRAARRRASLLQADVAARRQVVGHTLALSRLGGVLAFEVSSIAKKVRTSSYFNHIQVTVPAI